MINRLAAVTSRKMGKNLGGDAVMSAPPPRLRLLRAIRLSSHYEESDGA